MQLHALEQIFQIFYTFVCKKFSSCRFKFPGKLQTNKHKSKAEAFGEIEAQERPQKFVSRILCYVALVYNSHFFSTAVLTLFDIRFSYKHSNFSRRCLLVKMASKTVTRYGLFHDNTILPQQMKIHRSEGCDIFWSRKTTEINHNSLLKQEA